MKIARQPLTCGRIAGACAAFVILFAVPAPAAGRQALPRHLPAPMNMNLPPVDRLAGSKRLPLAIGLPLRNREGLTNLLRQISDPASPLYHQYLTPEQFTERFGPTEQDYQAVIAFAKVQGFTVTATHPNRVVLDVEGAVADIEKALQVTMRVYQHPKEARTFYAPDAAPSLDLAVPILDISGLDNYEFPHPHHKIRPLNQGANGIPNLGSGPGGAYRGNDFRAAYVPGTTLNGAGQNVGLVQFDGYYPNDISNYIAQAGITTSVMLTNVPIDGGVAIPGPNNVEVCLDIEMIIAMAPGVGKIFVYEAPNPSPWVDILSRMANDNQARQLSCSWGGGPPDATGEQIFQQMAAQGQSFFNACGDSDAFVGDIPFPSDSPNVTEVGGTTLTTTGPGGSFVSETVWNWGGDIGSCGGISTFYGIPDWQQGVSMAANQGSTSMRNVPDVALTADNVWVDSDNGQGQSVGGTSCAAPLWAGFTALVNQQAAAQGLPSVGFLNPTLYAIGEAANYTSDFHDTTTGNNFSPVSPTQFAAVSGYDLCTGWGTPVGNNLINVLLAPPGLSFGVGFVIAVSDDSVSGNGNGTIDYNECNDIKVLLRNDNSSVISNLTATLITTNPYVTVAQPVSPYPVMAPGATAWNQFPFRIYTAPNFPCGMPIYFTLRIETPTAVGSNFFQMPSGALGLDAFRYNNSSPVSIPDNSFIGADMPIAVSDFSSPIGKLTVSLHVSHPLDSDLTLQLIAPDGSIVTLAQKQGGLGQGYGVDCADTSRTVFDDASLTPITGGAAPFVGSFRPRHQRGLAPAGDRFRRRQCWLHPMLVALAPPDDLFRWRWPLRRQSGHAGRACPRACHRWQQSHLCRHRDERLACSRLWRSGVERGARQRGAGFSLQFARCG